ncbi:neural cell adhesion molecule 1-like [Lycorma delicatula]|uniref:neural cell adhesion molecule 1-like n=1 Tax=Lycorma delicatula TaxID=130591 RepID=UPI003F50EAB7
MVTAPNYIEGEEMFVGTEEKSEVIGSIAVVDAVLGRSAELPCNMEPAIKEDRVYMVLWFREGNSKPLYRFDVRGRPFNKALLWSDGNAFGSRAYFVTGKRPAAALQLEAVELKDAGVYRCRVDFRNSPTRNFQVNLSVIVPPHQLMIYDSSGRELHDVVGPLSEGSDLILTCEVRGGQPSPTVSWFVNDNLVEGRVEQAGANIIVNKLEVRRVRRHQLNSTFKCQASNTKLMQPAEKLIRLELFLRPLTVRLVNKPNILVAEKEYSITCEALGSRPQAELSWMRENRKFRRGKMDEWVNETVVTSTVVFSPAPEDDNHQLKCHGVNPKIPGSGLEDTITLNVVYAPLVSLQLGTSLKPHYIKEGDDVYFECNIRANPREHKISWFHNNQPVVQNVSSGVIISTHSLVLQGVTRQHAGRYTCYAANERGETSSQPVPLRVQYTPVCKSDEPIVVGASLDEMLKVKCEVNADPSDVSFFWQFNNSGESFEVSSTRFVTNNGTTSELMYTPSSERDYGTLTCWGKNSIGRQLEPCIFQVVPAEWVGSGGPGLSMGPVSLLLCGAGLSVCAALLLVALLAVRRRRDSPPCQLDRNSAVKQLEVPHGNQQRYVVAYQLKPETKQPDILSRGDFCCDKSK